MGRRRLATGRAKMELDGFLLQDWTTECGESATDVVIQNLEFVADVSRAAKVVARFDVLDCTNANLHLQTAKVPDKKYWRNSKTLTGRDSVVLTRDAGLTSDFMENFLRWSIVATGGSWKVTFRIQLFLK